MAGNAAVANLSTGSSGVQQTPTIAVSAPPPQEQGTLAAGTLLEQAPFPLEDTFLLHSLPSATKVIYLDFQGFSTQNTQWNTDFSLPNIITTPYDLDGNYNTFSSTERLNIQNIWERVSEDFRPFNVDVTTQDPGIEALRNTGGSDDHWGQRVVIGGHENDWFDPALPITAGGVSYIGSFTWNSDTPNFVFAADYVHAADIAEAVSHETGHSLGLVHDGQFRFYQNTKADPPDDLVKLYVEYYAGHGSGATAWAPIMGVGYGKNITQWSKGDYFNATNNKEGTSPLQDDLAVIVGNNGFGYRPDDHGNTTLTAADVVVDPSTVDSDVRLFDAEGIIEQNTDVDFFSFTVEGLGELVSLDIEPFHNGPNLDVLAKVYDSTGTVVATSDSIDALNAQFTDLALQPGTYYVSVQGGSRPITFVDPTFHPGPYKAEGNPPDPPLPADLSDWGYTNYGSLGYYSIKGTQKRNLVVGVDFDATSNTHPQNWNTYTGGSSPAVLTNLKSESGSTVPYQLTVSSTGTTINSVASANPITPSNLPQHGIPLDKLGGYLTTTTDTLTFEWSQLTPDTVYQIYVFGHASTSIQNHVTVIGGTWNGVQQVYDFTQVVAADGMQVNDSTPGTNDLTTYSLLVVSDPSGVITINVQGANGAPAGVAGLAITTTKVGSLSGQKWQDANGDKIHQSSEPSLADWRIYLDLNNDGQLNRTLDRVSATSAPNVPQDLADYATVKNDLVVTEADIITDVNVTFDIDHTYDADLNLTLVSPAGTRVKLFGDLGGSGDNFRNTTLDDEAATSIAAAAAPFTGTFRPQNPLSAFDGEVSAGKWTLEITDDATGDTGVLKSWSISITFAGRYLEPNQMTDANGNYSFTDLRAGQYIVREQFTTQQTMLGWKQSVAPAPITVRSGADVVGADFGNWIPPVQHGSLEGVVFDDANGNGARDASEAGLPGWTVYLDANGNGAFDVASTPTVYNATGLPQPILDFSVVNAPITINASGTVYNLELTLDITHSFIGDLDAYLLSPSGRQVELFTQVGDQYNNLSNVTLSDSASRSIATLGIADVPYHGTWRPEGLLSDFIGEDVSGTWILQIRDTAYADEGTLNSWSLKITSGETSRVTDQDGKYTFADLPAGLQTVREVLQSGRNEIAPNPTSIPGATWSASKWTVTVAPQTSVLNVNFGSQAALLAGDYNRSNVVDAADFVLWRKKLGTTVSAPYDGADGNGNGTVDAADYPVWRSNFGATTLVGSGSSALALSSSLAATASDAWATANIGNAISTTASSANWGLDTQLSGSSNSQLNSRPAYRPAAFAAVSSDQALLAWLAESGADEVAVIDGAAVGQLSASDPESVDDAFESLETVMLGDDGVV